MLAAALLVAAALAGEPASHHEPAPSTAERPTAESQRQATLSELWQRRILPLDVTRWNPEDLELLARVRRAEAAGAVPVLRDRLHGLKDLAVPFKPVGAPLVEWRLTKEGYERWRFLRAQDALRYFDSREIGAKWAFKLTDLDGQALFDGQGLLTDAGERVYDRVQAGLEAHWKTSAGEILGNRRPPKPAEEAAGTPALQTAPAPPKRPRKPRRTVTPMPQSEATQAPASAPEPEKPKTPIPHLENKGGGEAPKPAPADSSVP